MVPLGAIPALDFVIAEARAASIDRIGFVVRPDKPMLEAYARELTHDDGVLAGCEVCFIPQADPKGLGDALLCARDFLAGESFALLLPDNFLPSPDYALRDLVDLYSESGRDVLGVLELDATDSGQYGNCGRIRYRDFETTNQRLKGRALELIELSPKGKGTIEIPAGSTIRRTCGRYVCRPHLLDWLERVRPEVMEQGTEGGELSEVPAYQRIVAEVGACGLVLPRPVFDIGIPAGYLAASAWLNEQAANPS